MTVKDIQDILEEIKSRKDDDEVQHSMQDDLWEDVLLCIAHDPTNASELAREALKVLDIKFSRWCA